MHTSGVSDKFSELPSTSEHDQTMNQSDQFPVLPQAITSFHQVSQRKCSTPYPKGNLEGEIEVHQKQVYEVPQDWVIHSPSYFPLLPYFPIVPTIIVGQVAFNIHR